MRPVPRRRRVVGALMGMGLALAVSVGFGATAGPALAAGGNSGNGGSGSGASGGGGGSATFESYLTGASAPVFQITEDYPTALFHPQGEAEYNYTLATLDPSRGYGLAATVWPGGAAANAGALAVLLGAPPQATAVADPVRAEADSGGTPQSSTTAPNGTIMSAKANQQAASSRGQTAGGTLGPAGSVGASTSMSSVVFDASANRLTSTASTDAHNISIGGVVNIGSITSSAKAVSVNAAKPTVDGGTNISNVSVAGQPAYIDGSGIHPGQPGKPAPPATQVAVNTALKNFGMSVYTTSPTTIPIGGVLYYVAGSVTFFWQVPGDPNGDSFTMSFGGSAVSMGVTAGAPATQPVVPPAPSEPALPSNVPSGSVVAALGPPPSSAPLSLPSGSNGASVSAGVGRGRPASVSPANALLPDGVGPFWTWIILGGLVGGGTLPLLPGFFDKTAAAVCPRERRP